MTCDDCSYIIHLNIIQYEQMKMTHHGVCHYYYIYLYKYMAPSDWPDLLQTTSFSILITFVQSLLYEDIILAEVQA